MSGIIGLMTVGTDPEELPEPSPTGVRRVGASVGSFLGALRRTFRAFRRTRPFWGGLWLIASGVWILRMLGFSIGLVVPGVASSAGYGIAFCLIAFGLVSWFAPHYSPLLGILGVAAALGSFIYANLGGFVVGSVVGILGGSMVFGWGEKKPKQPREAAEEETQEGASDGE